MSSELRDIVCLWAKSDSGSWLAFVTPATCMQQKHLSEHERWSVLKDKIDKLTARVDTESAERVESHRSLRAHVDTELSKLAERVAGDLHNLERAMRSNADSALRSAADLSAAVSDEAEQRKVDIEHVGASICMRLDEVAGLVEAERGARLGHERTSLKRCALLCSSANAVPYVILLTLWYEELRVDCCQWSCTGQSVISRCIINTRFARLQDRRGSVRAQRAHRRRASVPRAVRGRRCGRAAHVHGRQRRRHRAAGGTL